MTNGDRDSFGKIRDDEKTPFGETKAPKESLGDLLRVDSDRKTSSSGSGHQLRVTPHGNRSDFGDLDSDEKEPFGETKASG